MVVRAAEAMIRPDRRPRRPYLGALIAWFSYPQLGCAAHASILDGESRKGVVQEAVQLFAHLRESSPQRVAA